MKVYVIAFAAILAASPASAHSVMASYYGGSDHLCGRSMSNGQKLDCRRGVHTVAHRLLPFGTKVKITYKGKSVDAVVTDRGPAKRTGRDLDLSLGTALDLGMTGVARVEYEVIEGVERVAKSVKISGDQGGGPSLFERLFGQGDAGRPVLRTDLRHSLRHHTRHR